ncbi:hypothetical protein I79_007005 [Cricetulus griseus]|uniref:Uncharacterized protein n=1 Tax=Cricetulus griseus TaxID=10029 RepID=G3H9D7_CRIGR|nr:hypothetical protein I79_007005 [Cricetulus griseus]
MDLSLQQPRGNHSHPSGFTTDLLKSRTRERGSGQSAEELSLQQLWFSEDGQTQGPLATTSTLPKGVPKLILTQEVPLVGTYTDYCSVLSLIKFCTYPSGRS